MIYVSEDCGSLFYWAGEVFEYPPCEGKRIHQLTEEETKRLRDILVNIHLRRKTKHEETNT